MLYIHPLCFYPSWAVNVHMQWKCWGDGQTDTVADIHFTYNRQVLWITRYGTIHSNGHARYGTIYHHDHGFQK